MEPSKVCKITGHNDQGTGHFRRVSIRFATIHQNLKQFTLTHSKPNRNTLDEYYNRCDQLKSTINYVEQPNDSRKLKAKSRDIAGGDGVLKEINQIQNEHYHSQMRKELMDTQNDLQAGLRKRGGMAVNSSDNMGQAMKYYGDMQEKIAEDMLSLTRNLKEQTEIANKIIRKDTEVSVFVLSLHQIRRSNVHKNYRSSPNQHCYRTIICHRWQRKLINFKSIPNEHGNVGCGS